jgi:hypothetical protein
MVLTLKINNNSKLFYIKDLLKCFEYCTNTNQHYRLKNYKYFFERNIKGIYFLYNNDKEIIYIGKTINCIRQRLKEHLYLDIRPELGSFLINSANLKRNESVYFSFIEVEKVNIDCAEVLLINKYKPKYNYQFNNC